MDEVPMLQIDANMTAVVPGLEKDEITRLDVGARDLFAFCDLLFGRSGNTYVKEVKIGPLNKGGAVYTVGAETAIFVRSLMPLVVVGIELVQVAVDDLLMLWFAAVGALVAAGVFGAGGTTAEEDE